MPLSRAEKRNIADLVTESAMNRFEKDRNTILTERRLPEFLRYRAWMSKLMAEAGLSISACGEPYHCRDFKTVRNAIDRGSREFPYEDWETHIEKLKKDYHKRHYMRWPSDRKP